VGYYFGQELTALFEALSEQIMLAIRHDCIRHNQPCTHCEERGQQAAIGFLTGMPKLRVLLATDIKAAYEGDPAAKGFDEIIFSYPGFSPPQCIASLISCTVTTFPLSRAS